MNVRVALTLVTSAVVAVSAVFGASPEWRKLATPRFTVISQLRENDTRAWATEFDQFITALGGVITIDQRLLPSLTVVIFASDRSFDPFKPVRPDGKGARSIAGYFATRETWGVIGLASRWEEEETRQLIFHEGVHWYVSADKRQYPLWFDEGLAEVFSTFSSKGGEARWGRAIGPHVYLLNQRSPMPLETLLHLDRDNPLFNESDRTGIFYAQAWSFVHYLLYGRRDGSRTALSDYLKGLATVHPDVAFHQAFGKDYAQMERDVAQYLRAGRYFVAKVAIDERGVTEPIVPATPGEVAVALARLAHGSNHDELARRHADEALQLSPDSVGAHEIKALLAAEAQDNAAVLVHAERAVALNSRDAWTLMLLGNAKWKAAQELGGVPTAEARQIANLYERAINLRPRMQAAYRNLAGMMNHLEKLTDQDPRFLELGHLLFPDDGEIILGLALVAHKSGDTARATQLLETALAIPGGMELERLKYARSLQSRWLLDGYKERIDALALEKKFPEAIALLDELAAKVSDVFMRNHVHQWRRTLDLDGRLHAAKTAYEAGRHDEARGICEELLARNGIPPPARRFAQEMLGRMNRRPAAAAP